MADTDGSNKRRRAASPPTPSSRHVNSLATIPGYLLAEAAAYLPTPSCVMFAVAMTAQSSAWRKFNQYESYLSATSKEILSSLSPWEFFVLDFEEVEEDLAKKLTEMIYLQFCYA